MSESHRFGTNEPRPSDLPSPDRQITGVLLLLTKVITAR